MEYLSKKDALALIRGGEAEGWNAYREVHPEWIPDLSGEHAGVTNISRFDLSHANLRGADLSGAILVAGYNRVDLTSAEYDLKTRFPVGDAPEDFGAILVPSDLQNNSERSGSDQGKTDPGAATAQHPISNRFRVALSFPGEHRNFVLRVAEALAAKLTRERVFYDEWYGVELRGAGGDLKLQAMYTQADLIVAFFSQYYDKPWCSMEWETIRGILLNRWKDNAVIAVHLDDTDVAGWSPADFGICLGGRTQQQIADLILQTLATRNPSGSATSPIASTATDPAGALAIWQEKLDFLQQQEAITADAAQKFAIKKQIEQAQQTIQELGGNP